MTSKFLGRKSDEVDAGGLSGKVDIPPLDLAFISSTMGSESRIVISFNSCTTSL
jgi:hypothetical protein